MSSSTSHSKLWGRRYSLKLIFKDGSQAVLSHDKFEPEALKMNFVVDYPGYQAFYMAVIEIWNVGAETEQKLIGKITEGTIVELSAGYQNEGRYGVIFLGKVFQPLVDRVNVTDFRFTLSCVDGKDMFENNTVNFTLPAGYTQLSLLQSTLARASAPINAGAISPPRNTATMPRGVTVFGAPSRQLRLFARDNNLDMYAHQEKINFAPNSASVDPNPIVVSPSTGLIGSPSQTDAGVHIRSLLNPNILMSNPCRLIKIDQALTRQELIRIGAITSILDADGTYKIIGVRHVGDTRGNDWYTEVIGLTVSGKADPRNAAEAEEPYLPSAYKGIGSTLQ